MKFKMRNVIITLLLTGVAQSASSEQASEHQDGPCIKIMEACKAAGFNKSSTTEKKSLSKNCMQPLLNGQKVEGVSVNPSDLESCKAKKNEVKLKK